MGSHVIHFEVTGKDGPGLQRFYSQVFGWKLDTNNPGGYGMIDAGGEGIGGGIGASQDGGPGHVTFYVHTADPAGTLRQVEQLGGRVLMPLSEVAPGTTIALFADPEGHVVGLM
ncbi:MAG: VOC family protein [Candidatus Limnocylindrales bacterium]